MLTVGAAESSVSVRVAAAVVLPAASAPVTISVGEVLVFCAHVNVFESYGPPAGLLTVEGVCVQPVAVPPRAAVALDAGPDSESLTAFLILNEPPPDWAPR